MEENSVKFLIEEYRNIAGTHDKLRELQTRLFNYFLLLSAFPFTVMGIIFRDAIHDITEIPPLLGLIFLMVGVGHFYLTSALVEARLSQYRYAKTVNLIRKYFSNNDGDLAQYLYLPISDEKPSWDSLGYIAAETNFMVFIGAVFFSYGVYSIVGKDMIAFIFAFVALLVYAGWFLNTKASMVDKIKNERTR